MCQLNRSPVTLFWIFSGLYFSGDGAYRSQYGHYQITGRMDDVLNVSGHRLGTAEIEDAIVSQNLRPTGLKDYIHITSILSIQTV